MIFLWVIISHGQFSIFIDISVYFRINGENYENDHLCDEKFLLQQNIKDDSKLLNISMKIYLRRLYIIKRKRL